MQNNTQPNAASTAASSSNLVATEVQQRSRLAVIGLKTAINVLPFWWVLVIAFSLSMVTAVYLSGRLSTTTHTVGAALVYHPLPVDGGAARLYFPPDLKTLTSLVNAAPVLERAIAESKAATTPLLLSRNLIVSDPKNSQRISLMLTSDDAQQGKEILNAVCESAQMTIADMRREVIGNTLQDLRTSLERSERRMKSGREELLKFTGRLQIDDVDTEIRDLTSELATYEYQLNTSQIEEQGLRRQHQIITDQLNEQKQKAQQEASDGDNNTESLVDARRRQDRLNELIREERRMNEVRAELDAKQAIFNRKIKLYEKGYISRSDFEDIESQVKQLQAQIMEGTRIEEWQAEVARLDKQIVPKAGKKNVGSPIINQIRFRLMELDLSVSNEQEMQRQIAMKQVEAKKRRQELRLFQQEQSALMLEIKAANDEHDTLNRQISSLTGLYEMGPSELTIADAPSSALQQPTSDRKKIFAGLFVGIFMLSTAPLILLAGITAARPTVMEHVAMRDLTFLSPQKSLLELMLESRRDRGLKWERQLALRIQQLLPKRGSVVSIFPAEMHSDDETLLQQIAETLQFREETVLIIRLGNPACEVQSRTAEDVLESVERTFGDSVPTLSDYLENEAVTVTQTIDRSAGNVDLVLGGQYNADRIFSRRMGQYLDAVSELYSIVLVYGMDLNETTSVEMLTGHSNGIILLHDRTDSLSGDVKRTIDNLCDIQAPMFGVATRPPEQKLSRRQRRRAVQQKEQLTKRSQIVARANTSTVDASAGSPDDRPVANAEVTMTTGENDS